jgi:hypothetical protein
MGERCDEKWCLVYSVELEREDKKRCCDEMWVFPQVYKLVVGM